MGTDIRKIAAAIVSFLLIMALLLGACALTFSLARFFSGDAHAMSMEIVKRELPTIVIDAGHGGMDSGAVGVDGCLEKEINLAVAERLYALFQLAGIDCVMTRTEDLMLVDDSVKSHRKMHDLKNRLAIVNELEAMGKDTVFLSIHMNNFSIARYSGLQVWYSASDARSRELATYVQSYAKTFLDPSNTREVKRATSSIYILDHITTPAILVECGFLSNPEECTKLGTEAYRNELAATIFAAVTTAIEKME